MSPRGGNAAAACAGSDDLDAAVGGAGLTPHFQPIVRLADQEAVGYEALARWPRLHGVQPREVFARASATDRISELDQRCIDTALHAALHEGLVPGALLSINTEPASDFRGDVDGDDLTRGRDAFRLVFELTERDLLRHPKHLLHKVAGLRRRGVAIALDDVGAHPDSLALLDVIAPDMIKLDVSLLSRRPEPAQAKTIMAVLAHSERSHALLVAEGIENDDHVAQSLALGATLGQGYKYGAAAPLWDQRPPAPWPGQPWHRLSATPFDTPFDVAVTSTPLRTAARSTLIELSRSIEVQAQSSGDDPVVLVALQDADNLSDGTLARYAALAATSPMVAIFGRHLAAVPAPGVRGVALSPADPLCTEWTVLVLGPHHAAALIARERADNDGLADGDRRFDFVITFDRDTISQAARTLLTRIA